MEYVIVEKKSPVELIKAVNKLLLEGWGLQGGISAHYIEELGTYYLQALVKLTDDPIPSWVLPGGQ